MAFFDIALPYFDILLPFFFVLAIVYGALEISSVFTNRGVKAIISVVLAFFAISSPAAIGFILFLIPYATIFFIAFFFLGFVLSVFKAKGGGERDYALVIIGAALLLLFISSEEYLDIINIQDENFIGTIVFLIIMLILLAAYKIKD